MRRLLLLAVPMALPLGCGPSEAPTTAPVDSTQIPEVTPQREGPAPLRGRVGTAML